MADVKDLLNRIDAEFAVSADKIKRFQAERVQEHQERQQRLELFGKVCDSLRDVWGPRLEALAERFGERVKVSPAVAPSRRQAKFQFNSELAEIILTLSATTDQDVRQLVLDYHLHILPVLMRFEGHSQIEFPLDAIDREAIGRWIDDRLVDFVRTYLSLHENQYYLKRHMVEDPVTHTRFPRFAAAATIEWQGKTYYFIGEESRGEFEKQHGLGKR